MNALNSIPLHEQPFIGRDEYLEEFRAWLCGERDHRILFIHGPGGIGKTWLLRKMITAVEKEEIPSLLVVDELIDLYATANHSINGLREKIVDLLEQRGFKTAFENYRNSVKALKDRVQSGYRDEDLVGMRQQIQDDFLKGCHEIAKEKATLFFLDTFERVQREHVGRWLLTDLVRDIPNFRLVIASREKWGGNPDIHFSKLSGFSVDEAREYFQSQGYSGDESLEIIYEKSKHSPLRIALAVEYLSELLQEHKLDELRSLTEIEFDEEIVKSMQRLGSKISLNRDSFDDKAYYILPHIAFFNRRFHSELLLEISKRLDLIGSEKPLWHTSEEVSGFMEKFQNKLFFVKTRPDGYSQLHDEVETLISRYWWPTIDLVKNIRRELASIAYQWYAQKIKEMEAKGIDCDDWKAERLIYGFWIDPDEVYQLLQAEGYASTMLNNLLVVEISPEKIKQLREKGDRYRFAVDLGERANRVRQFRRGQEYWQIAIDATESDDKKIEALLGLYNCAYPLNLERSLKILKERVLPLTRDSEKHLAIVLYEIGFTYSRMGNIPEAIKFYERAKKEARDAELMATILNDMGYAYVFIGEYERAGRFVKRGLTLRKMRVDRLKRLLEEKRKQLELGKTDEEIN